MPVKARSLTPTEAKVILSLLADRQEELSLADIARLARASPAHARTVAHHLARKGWIQRVGRGRYLLNPPSSGPDPVPDTNPYRVGSHLVSRYYFAYATAAHLHGLTTQGPRTYFIATPTRAARSLSAPADFRLVHLAPSKFFGWRPMTKLGARVHVSDPEKTVLDCIDRQDLAGDIAGAVEVLSRAVPSLDFRKLEAYVARMGSRSLAQRLGYLLVHARPGTPVPADLLARLRQSRGRAYVRLASPARHGSSGTYDSEWRVVRNVPKRLVEGQGARP